MQEPEAIYANIPGGPELLAWFGRVPSFHDAEILSICLYRKAPSLLRVHAWNLTSNLDRKGYFVADRHALVTFILEDISDLQLDGFTKQNVIDGISIERIHVSSTDMSRQTPELLPDHYEIRLEHCYGISGSIICRNLQIEFSPGKPDSIS